MTEYTAPPATTYCTGVKTQISSYATLIAILWDRVEYDEHNFIDGGAGDDIVIGGSGNNKLYGGDGNDTVFGGVDIAGQQRLSTWETGRDESVNRSGWQLLDGGAGDDMLIGGAGDNYLTGGTGNDLLNVTDVSSVFDLGASVYDNTNSWASQSLDGGEGDDILIGGHGSNHLIGGDGNDIMIGADGFAFNANNNTYTREEGANSYQYQSQYAFSSLDGGNGDDVMIGGVGSNNMDGGDGDDIMFGGVEAGGSLSLSAGSLWQDQSNSNMLNGGNGNDQITGGIGDNQLYGGNGNDVITGGAGYVGYFNNDGSGLSDGVQYAKNDIYGEAGDDVLLGGEGYNRLFGGIGDDVITAGSSNESAAFGGQINWHAITDGPTGRQFDNLLDGGEGNDTLIAGLLDDLMVGGIGRDTFLINEIGGSDLINDFGLQDELIIGGVSIDEISVAEDGADLVVSLDNDSEVRLANVNREGQGYSVSENDDGSITLDISVVG
jgi:Ca2+-binding RTX toxin-like protein